MKRGCASPAAFLHITIGFFIWIVAFALLYGAQATGCRLGWETVELAGSISLQRAVLGEGVLWPTSATRAWHRIRD